nr:hypothetical protein [uncultured Rhodoferax sp.]
MSLILCTIVTPDYVDRAVALALSAMRSGSKAEYQVLTTGPTFEAVPGFKFLDLDSLCAHLPHAAAVREKYGDDRDRLRWCLKPVLMAHLLRENPTCTVVYADSDIAFFRPPELLAQLLGSGSVLLTPHWRPPNPLGSTRNFRLNFMDGLFNAGCITAVASGARALQWWADACLSACEQNREDGLWDDQRYLDLMPIYFDGTIICRDRGFNLADWNHHLRVANDLGCRDVPDVWPVSMVHFTPNTIKRIERGDDPLLEPYLNEHKGFLAEAITIIQRGSQAHGVYCYGLPDQLDEARTVPANT